MTSSFYTLNHPSHGLGFISKHRRQNIARRNGLAVPPSSIIPKEEESGNPPDSKQNSQSNTAPHVDGQSGGSLLTHSSFVGIIGGVSIKNNLSFVNKLVKWSSKDKEDSLPFVLCSDPVLSRELSSHERSYFPLLAGKSKDLTRDHSSIIANLRHKRSFLENAGARCIVMPCNISHSWYDDVVEVSSVPLLHIGDCVAKELKEAKLKPLEAGSRLRIGIIATNATLEAGFYQEKLQKEGFEAVLPDKATMEHTIVPAMEALNSKDIEGAQNLFRIALQVLLVRAVNTVILASDDLQDLLPPDDPLLKKCIDPTDALARSTIKFTQSAEIAT